MLDLKTGRFVIDAEKGWELHPFMSRKEFLNSALFYSEYLDRKDLSLKDDVFGFGPMSINGYEMYMTVDFGGLHDCVERIRLISTKLSEIPDINNMPSNWKEIAYETKRIHDEFLQKETSMAPSCLDEDKDNSYMVSWGSFRSDFCLRYDIPDVEIVINYDNLTEEDKAELEKIPDDELWS